LINKERDMDREQRLNDIRTYFVNHGFKMSAVNRSNVGTLAKTGFVVHINLNNSYLKLCNNKEENNKNWFIERLPAIKQIVSGSLIHESTKVKGKYWFELPLNHIPAAEEILKILVKTRKIMNF
jgi:hypothetical protein